MLSGNRLKAVLLLLPGGAQCEGNERHQAPCDKHPRPGLRTRVWLTSVRPWI